jgi:hypothetical protein
MQAVLVALLALVAVANAENLLSAVPAKYHMHIPQAAKDQLVKINKAEFDSACKIAKNALQFQSASQLQDALKKAAPTSYALAAKHALQAQVLAAAQYHALKSKLSPASQQFFGDLSTLAQKLGVEAQKVGVEAAHLLKNQGTLLS